MSNELLTAAVSAVSVVPDRTVRLFADDYWQWLLRNITAEPDPADYGIEADVGEKLARTIHVFFEDRVKAKIRDLRKNT